MQLTQQLNELIMAENAEVIECPFEEIDYVIIKAKGKTRVWINPDKQK